MFKALRGSADQPYSRILEWDILFPKGSYSVYCCAVRSVCLEKVPVPEKEAAEPKEVSSDGLVGALWAAVVHGVKLGKI